MQQQAVAAVVVVQQLHTQVDLVVVAVEQIMTAVLLQMLQVSPDLLLTEMQAVLVHQLSVVAVVVELVAQAERIAMELMLLP